MTSAHKGVSYCPLSLDQDEAEYWHTSTLTLPKHLCLQNIYRVCWCLHEHDTCIVAVIHRPCHCDSAALWQSSCFCWQFCVFGRARGQAVGENQGRGGGSYSFRCLVGVTLCFLALMALAWLHPGSIPQVGWGLIVNLKYSWAHRVDKWRYKNTVKFSIGQMSLTSPDTIYCVIWHLPQCQLIC